MAPLILLRATVLAQTGSVKGVVVDPALASVAFAKVVLEVRGAATPTATTQTDVMGHFELSASPGTYDLRVTAPGFEFYTKQVSVVEGKETDFSTISLRVGAIAKCEPGPLGPPTISVLNGSVLASQSCTARWGA